MAQQDPHSRQQGGHGDHARRYDEESWYQGRASDVHDEQWKRTQPRQGGAFEDRYSGRGGHESRGNENTQRSRWRERPYGQGRYQNEDYFSAGGSYGGQYEEEDASRFYSPYEGARDGHRRGQQQRGSEDRSGYGYEEGRDSRVGQPGQFGREMPYGQGMQSDYERWTPSGGRWSQAHSHQDYGYGEDASRSYGSGLAERYGPDYSMTGSGMQGQWDRGYGEMFCGASGDYSGSSWLRGDTQHGQGRQRHSFRGKGPKGYQRSDERLKELICERLTDDPQIDASEIEVEVSNCEVTLEGTVHDRRMKYEAEELIDQCSGVKEVRNNLRVRARGSESGSDRSDASNPSSSRSGGMTSGTTTGAGAGTQSRKNG